MPFVRLLLLPVAALTAVGCAGARVRVTADHAKYPISMSEVIRDDTGRLHERQWLRAVGHLDAEKNRIGLFYSALTPRSTYDISDEVNAQVAAAQGEAVVQLSITVAASCNVLNAFPVLTILPFWPGCVPIKISGVIVRRRELAAGNVRPMKPALPLP